MNDIAHRWVVVLRALHFVTHLFLNSRILVGLFISVVQYERDIIIQVQTCVLIVRNFEVSCSIEVTECRNGPQEKNQTI